MKINVNESFDILIGRHSSKTRRTYCVELLMLCMIRWILCIFQNKKNIIVCQKLKILLPWKSAHCVLISVQISSYKMLGRRFLVLWTEVKSFDTSAQVFWKSFESLLTSWKACNFIAEIIVLGIHIMETCQNDFHFIMIMTRICTWLLSSAENGDWGPQQHVRTPLRMVTMVITDRGEYMISMNSMNPWVVPK